MKMFMWAAMIAVMVSVPAALWMCATIPLIVWLALNGVVLVIFAIVCAVSCADGFFDWGDIDHIPVMWSVMAVWTRDKQPSFARIILWSLMIPAEIVASFVVRPITLGIRLILKPMPSRWN